MSTSFLLISTAVAEDAGTSLGLFGSDVNTGFLLVALMLLFLLLARVHRRESAHHGRPPPRHNPISYEELARTVYRLASSCDLEGYRGLFLAGGEAAAVFGDRAEGYLASRSVEVLEESLVTIGAHLAAQPRFHGVRLDSDDRLFLQVRRTGDKLDEVDLGTVTRVGAVVRLVEAPYRSG